MFRARLSAAILVAAGIAVSGPESRAQTTPAVAEATTEKIEPGAAAPDPLTPPKVEEPAPAAPGAPPPAASAPATIELSDPIVVAVRQRIDAGAAPASTAMREDRAALAAFYNDSGGRPVWTSANGLTERGASVIAELNRAADYGLEAAALAIPQAPREGAATEAIAEAEIAIGRAVLTYARHARGSRVDPASVSKMIDHAPRVYAPKSVLEAIAAAPAADAYLRGLNPQHDGFERLRKALLAVRAGGEAAAGLGLKGAAGADVETRILVNMERWRWMPDDMGAFHVWDNVPEQITRVMKDGRAVLTEKIVVGKPITQTPEFSAPMRFVIFHPTWGVPDGIKSNELGPLLRRASANNSNWLFGDSGGASRVLKRHELRVSQNGREVNPDSIDWSRVDARQFQFTQPPSGKNVLGVVKFRFPNRFDVYMHDTQDKQLFANSTRAFSHGCMRVQNPMRLAEVILAHDKGWSGEKVAGFVSRGATADITLETPVPVHVTYFTAAVDDDGRLRLYGDLYGRDARVASALTGRPVSLASVPIAAAPAAETPPVAGAGNKSAQAKSGKQQAGARGKDPVQKAAAFNPFGGLSSN